MSPLFPSLEAAARLVVIQPGFALTDIKLDRWAETYRCSPDDVEQALKIAQNGARKLPEEEAVGVAASQPGRPSKTEPSFTVSAPSAGVPNAEEIEE